MPNKFVCFVALWLTLAANAQSGLTPNQEKISNTLTEYFAMDRENIHLHLNKNTFLTNEQIWFKGYIIDKKNKTPFTKTSNVYTVLYDDGNQKISNQLYYAENGMFEGLIKLDPKLKTGKYFLQVFTNYMNNFYEDESSVYEITIINPADASYQNNQKIDYDSIKIEFFPEGGIFLEGISNSIGIKISDCRGNGIAVDNGEITDGSGNFVTTFSTNQLGYGKFEINDTGMQSYKAAIEIMKKKVEKALPLPSSKGIALACVNYITPEKTIVKLKTNQSTLKEIKNLNYSLVIQQDQAVSFVDFTFDGEKTEQMFFISNSQISAGINTIHLIDSEQHEISERVIYNPFTQSNNVALSIGQQSTESILINGSIPLHSANISISVLPVGTIAENERKSVNETLQLDNYLFNTEKNRSYYFTEFSRKKHYELDAYLLTQKSKYNWKQLLGNPPEKKFDFDMGLTIKGTINTEVTNHEDYSIHLNCLWLGLREFTPLNAKREFTFENVIVLDSTKLYFEVLDKKGKKLQTKIYSQLLGNNQRFMKPFSHPEHCIAKTRKDDDAENIPLPKFENAIELDSITIMAKKNKLLHEDKSGTGRGFKISDKDATRYRDLLHFIGTNGFTVSNVGGNVSIDGYGRNSGGVFSGRRNIRSGYANATRFGGPVVFIDGNYVQDYDILRDYSLTTVDEIYINRNSSDLSVYGSRGIIRVYSKKNMTGGAFKTASQGMVSTNGFQNFIKYKNPKYASVYDAGFQNFGTIDWKPNVQTDENGSFHFSIPNLYQKAVKVIIEGISNDGQLISVTKILKIE
ncbi:hypothetical protein [Flavobacterium sp.]|uniref:hypothetical protein n=1 Tax=Flavobacterium sp. TaxID=239 RepID=UPI0026267855|nr:hypothetical protein [Flavobacterium sp.]